MLPAGDHGANGEESAGNQMAAKKQSDAARGYIDGLGRVPAVIAAGRLALVLDVIASLDLAQVPYIPPPISQHSKRLGIRQDVQVGHRTTSLR
jgi:hypothetical protein